MRREVWVPLASLIALLLLIAGLAFTSRMQTKGPRVRVNGQTITVEVADTTALRTQGLSGRASLEANTGMLFLFPEPNYYVFWMKDMRFPIDIIWIRGTTIIGMDENISPPLPRTPDENLKRYMGPEPVDTVLELAAGSARRIGILPGQSIELLLP